MPDNEDIILDQVLEEALIAFDQEMRALAEKRKAYVARKITEEMALIRPDMEKLLSDPTRPQFPLPNPTEDRHDILAEAKNERDFRRAVRRALDEFCEEVRSQQDKRKNLVASKILEEMTRLRPHAQRLLYGVEPQE